MPIILVQVHRVDEKRLPLSHPMRRHENIHSHHHNFHKRGERHHSRRFAAELIVSDLHSVDCAEQPRRDTRRRPDTMVNTRSRTAKRPSTSESVSTPNAGSSSTLGDQLQPFSRLSDVTTEAYKSFVFISQCIYETKSVGDAKDGASSHCGCSEELSIMLSPARSPRSMHTPCLANIRLCRKWEKSGLW